MSSQLSDFEKQISLHSREDRYLKSFYHENKVHQAQQTNETPRLVKNVAPDMFTNEAIAKTGARNDNMDIIDQITSGAHIAEKTEHTLYLPNTQ